MNNDIKKLIRELVEEELAEVSSSGAAGPFNTPFAFRGNSAGGKAKAKTNATQAGMEIIKGQEETADNVGDPDERVVSYGDKAAGALKKPSKEKVVQESRYTDLKLAEGHPRQKIGTAIREISRQLSEIDKVVSMSSRLKTESGLSGGNLWKGTMKSLTKLESKLNTIGAKLRELKA